MTDRRIRVAAGLLIAVVSTIGAAHAAAAAPVSAVRYACEGRQTLVVSRSDDAASVRFIDRTYELRRKPSSIGEKYGSDNAALIVDGSSAVFVAQDRLQLGTCSAALELASAN